MPSQAKGITLFICTIITLTATTTPQSADDGTLKLSKELYTSTQSSTLRSTRMTACVSTSVTFDDMDDATLATLRTENQNVFIDAIDILVSIFVEKDYDQFFDERLILPAMICLLVVFVTISTVIFFVYICCCCCNEPSSSNSFCVYWNMMVWLLGLLGFIALCVVTAVYFQDIQDDLKKVNCSLQVIPDNLINGAIRIESDLMGLYTLSDIITMYKDKDFDSLKNNHVNDIQAIKNLNLAADAENAMNSLDTFCDNCSGLKTTDADGAKEIPLSVSKDLAIAVLGAQEEFRSAYRLGEIVGKGADNFQSLRDSYSDPTILSMMDYMNLEVSEIITNIESAFTNINERYQTVDDSYGVVQIVFLVLCCVFALTSLILFIILCCGICAKNVTRFCCWRTFVAILGFFSLVIMVYSAVIGIVTFYTSASCGLLQDIETTEGIAKFSSLLSLTEQETFIMQTCLADTGTGDWEQVLKNHPDYKDSVSLMYNHVNDVVSMATNENLSSYNFPSDNKPVSLMNYSTKLETYKSGTAFDHSNVESALATLNSIVACDNRIYNFGATTCENGKTCINLKTQSSYNTPSCQTDFSKNLQAEDLVGNLNTYISETVTLADDLIEKSTSMSASPSTPTKLYSDLLGKFVTMNTHVDSMYDSMVSVRSKRMNSTLKEDVNCKQILPEIRAFEKSLCFEFVPKVFNFMIFAFTASLCFFLLSWGFCCSVFCLERSKTFNALKEVQYQEEKMDLEIPEEKGGQLEENI